MRSTVLFKQTDFVIIYIYGLEPGWLGALFGLRSSYVRIIITRFTL